MAMVALLVFVPGCGDAFCRAAGGCTGGGGGVRSPRPPREEPETCAEKILTDKCDGEELFGKTCVDFGFAEPEGLACTSACSYDTSGCAAACGNAITEPGEDCDDGDDHDAADGCHGCALEGANCDTAIAVALELGRTHSIAGNNFNGGDHTPPQTATASTCVADVEHTPDRVYQVTAQADGFLTATLVADATDFDAVLYALADCRDATSGIACVDATRDGGGGEALSFAVTAGASYTLIVDGRDAMGRFTLDLDLSAGTCADPVPMALADGGLATAAGDATAGAVVYELSPGFTGAASATLASPGGEMFARGLCDDPSSEIARSDDALSLEVAAAQPLWLWVEGGPFAIALGGQ